jgi:glyoxylase-like metal-dependent hydrolase (beta-lactamase superfamily II)
MKKIATTLFAILIIAAASAQKPNYKVYAIQFANPAISFAIADWAESGPKTDSVKIDFMVWLVKGDNGKNILLDAGFLSDIEDAKEFRVINYTRPDSALTKLNIKANEITDVILSHPHWDHIDGINLFPNAQVWMQQEDYNYFVGSAWQKGGDNGGYNKRDARKLLDVNLAGKLNLINGDNKEIIPGITVYTGARHTFNSQYVKVNTGNNDIVLASDNIWIYYSLEHETPNSKGGTLDPAGQVKAMQRMKTMVSNPRYIIPGHDHRIFETFITIAPGVAEIK